MGNRESKLGGLGIEDESGKSIAATGADMLTSPLPRAGTGRSLAVRFGVAETDTSRTMRR
jgi:hypothetical protein